MPGLKTSTKGPSPLAIIPPKSINEHPRQLGTDCTDTNNPQSSISRTNFKRPTTHFTKIFGLLSLLAGIGYATVAPEIVKLEDREPDANSNGRMYSLHSMTGTLNMQ